MDHFRESTALMDTLGDWMSGSGPLFRRLAAALERAIRSGDLALGERLPSERHLAELLAVSRATVIAAYDHLRGLGIVDSRRGSGTRVGRAVTADRARVDGRVRGGQATSILQRLVDGPGEIISLAFATEAAMPELRPALLDLVHEDLPDLLGNAGYYPRGLPALRHGIARRYVDDGLPTVPDDVLVTTGATQAISLVTQMYVRRGATIVVEAPGWSGCMDMFRAAGATLVGVPLDDEGIRVDILSRVLSENTTTMVYVMPTYHNPTGVLMSAARRQQVVDLAARHRVPVLEDSAYCTFAADASMVRPPKPLAAYAAPSAEVITVGSLSKSLWAGLRIGWVRANGDVTERLARYKALADLGSPVLDQALAARLLPQLAELTAVRARTLHDRRCQIERLLETYLPTWTWQRPDGGSALWIRLPETEARVFAQVALRHGVEVVPGANMDPSGAHDSFIRLPYTFAADILDEVVRRLTAAWHDLQRQAKPAPAAVEG